MEQAGFVRRESDPDDRRVLRVYPTEKAEAALPRVCELMEEWNRLLLEELNPEEQACLLTLLSRVTRKAICRRGTGRRAAAGRRYACLIPGGRPTQ